MLSDLNSHPETKAGENPYLMLLGGMYADNHDSEGVRRWIEGFR